MLSIARGRNVGMHSHPLAKLSLVPRLISSTGLHEKEPGYEAMADQMQKEIYVEHTYFQHCILESKELQRETLLLTAVIEYSVTINRKSQKRLISVVNSATDSIICILYTLS